MFSWKYSVRMVGGWERLVLDAAIAHTMPYIFISVQMVSGWERLVLDAANAHTMPYIFISFTVNVVAVTSVDKIYFYAHVTHARTPTHTHTQFY